MEIAFPRDSSPAEIVFDRSDIATSPSTQKASVGMDHTDRNFFIWVNGDDRLNIDADGNVGIGKTNPENPLHVKSDDADKPSPIRLESIIGPYNIAVEICVYYRDPNNQFDAPRGSLCIVPFSYGTPPKLYMNHSDSGYGSEWGLLAETQE